MQNQQNRSVQQLSLPNILSRYEGFVSRGIISDISNNPNAPLIIKLEDGQTFGCGGLSCSQHQSSILNSAIGYTAEFHHNGFNLQGLPINPSFKTLVITTFKGEGK